MGNGHCSQFITLCCCCSIFLTLLSCSSVASIMRDAVLCELLQDGTFPWAVVLHELLQHEVQFIRDILQYRSLMGACSCMGSPQFTTSFWASPPAAAWDPPCVAGRTNMCHHGLLHRLQGKLLWHLEHLPQILLRWPWCLQCFSHIFSLSSVNCGAVFFTLS